MADTFYYVVPDTAGVDVAYKIGSWPSADLSDATARHATIFGVLAAAGNGAGDTSRKIIVLSGGPVGLASVNYVAPMAKSPVNVLSFAGNYQTLRGCKPTDAGYALHGGAVSIDYTGYNFTALVTTGYTGQLCENFTLIGTDYANSKYTIVTYDPYN